MRNNEGVVDIGRRRRHLTLGTQHRHLRLFGQAGMGRESVFCQRFTFYFIFFIVFFTNQYQGRTGRKGKLASIGC
jgi:hypothetical protein